MILSYNECIEKYNNAYQLANAIAAKEIYKIAPGIYSDAGRPSELELISYKYPDAIFTMNSAFYYHSLSDTVPEKYHLATLRSFTRFKDERIKQSFYRDNLFLIGSTTMDVSGTKIRIYDPERMLIELVRNKNNLPFDYYKEIVESYRRRTGKLDIEKLQNYLPLFPFSDSLYRTIQLEVF